jgi:hypothetical protein
VAAPLLPQGRGGTGGPAAAGPAPGVPRRGGHAGQGPGLRAARRQETPLARWTCPELARKASASGIEPAPSPSTVRRWLAADALKPWQHRSWIFPRDRHLALRAGRVLDLYQREWEGQALGDDEYVISADEKPGIQARSGWERIESGVRGRGQPHAILAQDTLTC